MGKVKARINRHAIFLNLEVKMRAGDSALAARESNLMALLDDLAVAYECFGEMKICSKKTIIVFDQDV